MYFLISLVAFQTEFDMFTVRIRNIPLPCLLFPFLFIKFFLKPRITADNESVNFLFLLKYFKMSMFKNLNTFYLFIYRFFVKVINWFDGLFGLKVKYLSKYFTKIKSFIFWRPLFKKWSYFGLFMNARSKFKNLF